MDTNNDNYANLTTTNITEQRILSSLIGQKTAKELSIQLKVEKRTVQRILKALQTQGKVRTMTKPERRLLNWAPDPSAYPWEHWKNHTTDLRIPVYVLKSDPSEVRGKIDDLLRKKGKSASRNTCLLLLDLINGKYESYNPQYSDFDKLSKMPDFFQMCQSSMNAYIVQNSVQASTTLFDLFISETIILCERLRSTNPENKDNKKIKSFTRKLKEKGSVSTQFVYLFISEALALETGEQIEEKLKKLLLSFKGITDKGELRKAISTLHNLKVRGGFPNILKKIHETLLEIAIDLSNLGAERDLIDELLGI
ncbi:MAG: hypothetical protein M1166_05065 [Candidatus Thermoplasmatota archaeon]|jgi:DNA-binding transcriptional ArsR family regulator|nr:hypothetical protein [Candidatus Thermoplasmatota archaeon]